MSTQANDDSLMVEVSPSKAYELALHVIKQGHVPMLHGAPMTAKSSIMRKVAKTLNLQFIDCRLTTKDTVDLTGMVQVTPYEEDAKGNVYQQVAYYVPFDIFPLHDTPLPKDKKGVDMAGWLLFFDEITSISKPMEVASYQIILDRTVGQAKLHSQVCIAAAGNDPKHGAVANSLGTAARTRLVHIYVKQDVNAWATGFAYSAGIDPRLIAFVREYPQYLTTFEPKTGAITYCGSRTLEMLSDLINGLPISYDMLPLIAGTIGLNAAQDLINFETIYSQLESFADMMQSPVKDRSFLNPTQQFILVDKLISGCTTTPEFDNALRVVTPFGPEYPVLLARGVMDANVVKNLNTHPTLRNLVREYTKYFG